MGVAFFVALALTACSGDPDTRGGLTKAQADELNQAAEALDTQQAEVDEALASEAEARR